MNLDLRMTCSTISTWQQGWAISTFPCQNSFELSNSGSFQESQIVDCLQDTRLGIDDEETEIATDADEVAAANDDDGADVERRKKKKKRKSSGAGTQFNCILQYFQQSVYCLTNMYNNFVEKSVEIQLN